MRLYKFISVVLLLTLFVQSVSASGASYEALSREGISGLSTSAQAAVLYCCDNGDFVYASNADARLPMASTTKIMTALVAIENSDLQKMVKVARSACGVEGSSIYLYENEAISIKDLLYAVMLESANDAATALAIEVGGSLEAFVDMMNRKASELGLKNTSYKNPHGLDEEGHYSSAADLALLMTYAMSNEVFAEITGSYKYTAKMTSADATRVFINHNRLLNSCEGVCGGKTGYTKKSGRCLVTYANREGVSMCAVTLNDGSDWNDHTTLYDAGFPLYRVFESSSKNYRLSVVGAQSGFFDARSDGIKIVVKNTDTDKIKETVEHARFYYSNVKQGDKVGRVVYSLNGKELRSTDIVSVDTVIPVKHKGLLERIISIFNKD